MNRTLCFIVILGFSCMRYVVSGICSVCGCCNWFCFYFDTMNMNLNVYEPYFSIIEFTFQMLFGAHESITSTYVFDTISFWDRIRSCPLSFSLPFLIDAMYLVKSANLIQQQLMDFDLKIGI